MRDDERIRRTCGTPQCSDTACRVHGATACRGGTEEEFNAEIARVSTVS